MQYLHFQGNIKNAILYLPQESDMVVWIEVEVQAGAV